MGMSYEVRVLKWCASSVTGVYLLPVLHIINETEVMCLSYRAEYTWYLVHNVFDSTQNGPSQIQRHISSGGRSTYPPFGDRGRPATQGLTLIMFQVPRVSSIVSKNVRGE